MNVMDEDVAILDLIPSKVIESFVMQFGMIFSQTSEFNSCSFILYLFLNQSEALFDDHRTMTKIVVICLTFFQPAKVIVVYRSEGLEWPRRSSIVFLNDLQPLLSFVKWQ